MNYFNAQCDAVIVPSQKIAGIFQSNLYKYKPVLISTGVDAYTPTQSRQAIRIKYGLDKPACIFAMASRLVKEKKHRLALEAFALVAVPATQLLIIGAGPELKTLKRQARRLGLEDKVMFVGRLPRSEVRDLLAASDCYLNVSMRETQGLVINEAAHAGLALLVCEKDINECVIERKTALMPAQSAKAIAQAMAILAQDKAFRRRLGAAAKVEAQKHTIARQADATLKIYEQVLAGF
jgi:glycosyltransferase involved in cell wall biosynthesis